MSAEKQALIEKVGRLKAMIKAAQDLKLVPKTEEEVEEGEEGE